MTLAEGLRFKWEGHAEFATYTFFAEGGGELAPAAILERAGWPDVAFTLPGEVLVAVSIDLVPFAGGEPPPQAFRTKADPVIGGAVAEGRGWAYADFRIREDGFTRFLLLNREMGLGQAGRMVQRLLEIETYRMMALLAFPVARRWAPDLGTMEMELAAIVERIAGTTPEDEARLLDDLTRLAARVEHLQSTTRFRFEAAEAYEALVNRRLAELREVRIAGLSTIEEFLHRRLAPAMATCRSASRRIGNLAARVTRASALLRTRVDIARDHRLTGLTYDDVSDTSCTSLLEEGLGGGDAQDDTLLFVERRDDRGRVGRRVAGHGAEDLGGQLGAQRVGVDRLDLAVDHEVDPSVGDGETHLRLADGVLPLRRVGLRRHEQAEVVVDGVADHRLLR